jgi:hypothetical protein
MRCSGAWPAESSTSLPHGRCAGWADRSPTKLRSRALDCRPPISYVLGDTSLRENTMFKLFWAPRSCALASHIALEEAGAEYSIERIDFTTDEQRSAEYLAINPKGRVPTLVTDRGIIG